VYYAGYNPSGYSVYGWMSGFLGADLRVTPDAGYEVVAGSETYTVKGHVTLTGWSDVTFRSAAGTQTFSAPMARSLTNEYDFTLTIPAGQFGLVAPGSLTQPELFSWSGQNPYAQGPDGTASLVSQLSIRFDSIQYSATVVALPVPEPGSAAMLVLGLAGVGLVVRRRRAH
jgi:hypothetical protein